MHVGETKSIVSSNLTNPTFSLTAFLSACGCLF
jgi:hypothetical protein